MAHPYYKIWFKSVAGYDDEKSLEGAADKAADVRHKAASGHIESCNKN